MIALLDGKQVDSSEIVPTKHKFIGMWRPPSRPTGGVHLCSCGQSLWTVDKVIEHWHVGHMDEPQYVTIGKDA